MDTLSTILLANAGIGLLSLIGVLTLTFSFLNRPSVTTSMVSFAAGVLLATSAISVLPEALEGLDLRIGLSWFMNGIIAAFLLERFLLWYHHHHEDSHNINPTSSLVLIGDGVHNFIDGLAIAAAFMTHPTLGITATLAIAAHEIPQELADYSILRHCGMSKKDAFIWNFISASVALIGGLCGYFIFRESTEMVHYALALTAGIFMYIAAADLIPELHHNKTPSGWIPQTLLFLAGVVSMLFITLNSPHTHEHDAIGFDTVHTGELEEDHHEETLPQR